MHASPSIFVSVGLPHLSSTALTLLSLYDLASFDDGYSVNNPANNTNPQPGTFSSSIVGSLFLNGTARILFWSTRQTSQRHAGGFLAKEI